MRQHTITLAAGVGADDAASAWPARLLTAWPRTRAPVFERIGVAELIARGAAAREGPALVVLGGGSEGVELFQAIDALRESLAPGVILLPDAFSVQRTLPPGGVLVEPWSVNPSILAAMLFALAEQQQSVRQLVRDVQISARHHGGVRGEMDRLHDEMNLAAAVQKEMLPKRLPAVAGMDFGVLYRPASYVSGDIYDLVQLDEARVGFFIADAVGHGVPAALLTMVISRSLSAWRGGPARGALLSPGEALSALNDELCEGRSDSPRFSTAVCGVVDVRTREVTLSGAGHPPPLRIVADGHRRVETDGPLLGVFPGERYGDVTFTLAENETLLLYSDGFETAFQRPQETTRSRGSEDYIEKLISLAWPGRQGGRRLADAIAQLGARLDGLDGSLHQIDDLTALALTPTSLAASAAEPADMAKAA